MAKLLKFLAAYFCICLVYVAWATGFTFSFTELGIWPNYNMLAEALAKGRLHLDRATFEDYILVDGRVYLYAGPVPALLRLPSILLFGAGFPTGLMIVFFCAGVNVAFALILEELGPETKNRSGGLLAILFTITIIFNGFGLFMLSLPSFHHEAISGAMFFLLVSFYLLLRIKNRDYQPKTVEAILLGLSIGLCIGCRISYTISVGILGLVLLWGTAGCFIRDRQRRPLGLFFVTFGISAVSLASLLVYNYARFGSFTEFGIKYFRSVEFSAYFSKMGFFRYDHLPFNLWSYFFRIPEAMQGFPFINLPKYIVKVESYAFSPYFLINANELSASAFYLAPILLLGLVPLLMILVGRHYDRRGDYALLLAIGVVQVLPTAFSVASTARYYYDFLPIMMLTAYLGAVSLAEEARRTSVIVAVLCVVSIALSFSLPMNGILFYRDEIAYKSPLISIFFGGMP
ncbi:hypothetical protein ACFL2Q_05895 [Thermodesulfobacteriota bacterium]